MSKQPFSWTPQRVMDCRNRPLPYPGGTVTASLRCFGGGWSVELRDHEGRRHREDELDILSVCALLNDLQPELPR